jgi:hypothetical protein
MAARERIHWWYGQYWAQSWYRNTYLVDHPREIARQTGEDRDWNNVHDSGCNFACLAMIIGIDPARLASALIGSRFFRADRRSRARDTAGRIVSLVWDQNEPQSAATAIRLRKLWMPSVARRMSVTLRFVAEEITFDHGEGRRIVARARRRGEHIIAGSREHSHLVAGRGPHDYLLWDPDDVSTPVEHSLAGRLTLGELFHYYVDEPIEFWRYALAWRTERSKPPPSDWSYEG